MLIRPKVVSWKFFFLWKSSLFSTKYVFNYCSFAPIHRLNEQFQKQVNSWTMIISYWWNHNKRTKKIELPAKWELFPFDDLHFICWQAFTQNGNSCQVSTFLKKWFKKRGFQYKFLCKICILQCFSMYIYNIYSY